MRAIDLYSGIGGWSLGLRLAGVEVVASYEWWQPAIDTHNGNYGGKLRPVDIRTLKLSELPTQIDLVVCSPPCTQFSYSNRGGSGDVADGLKDLVKFLEVVEYLQPKYWALENVPRVADVLRRGFATPGHLLHRFADLGGWVEVFDFSEFGTAQSRRRCIAGNVPLGILASYRDVAPRLTLGDVVSSLASPNRVVDPVWQVELPFSALTETEFEPALNKEELRMNREAKEFHPIYNNMSFPDDLDSAARTVTATCTRVSRESIVIRDNRSAGSFRRLNIRERASLQGFPITYQFYAKSFAEKAKMIGNAIPPTFTYLLALSARGLTPENFRGFGDAGQALKMPPVSAPVTQPDQEGRTYPKTRSFRAALPGLRFKSGMRFELANEWVGSEPEWRVRFFFGSSKDIREIELDGDVMRDLKDGLLTRSEFRPFIESLSSLEERLRLSTPQTIQLVWTRRASGLGPYDVVDILGDLAALFTDSLSKMASENSSEKIESFVLSVVESSSESDAPVPGIAKLKKNASKILAGFVIGDWFNTVNWTSENQAAA